MDSITRIAFKRNNFVPFQNEAQRSTRRLEFSFIWILVKKISFRFDRFTIRLRLCVRGQKDI